MTRSRREDPRRPARRPRRRYRILRSGRELHRRPRRAPGRPNPPRRRTPRGRRREHGRGLRQVDRTTGHLFRDAGAGSDARRHRRLHGVSGLDAADPLRRPGTAGTSRTRSVPGARLRSRVWCDDEAGDRGRGAAEQFPEITARAFYTAVSGRPGPVVVALPEDVLSETADVEDAAQFSPARGRAVRR